MEKFQAVLLNVWREACRQIEINHSLQAITPLLLPDLPLQQLLIRRIDPPRYTLETVACGLPDQAEPPAQARTVLSQTELEKLWRWCQRGEISQSLPAGSAAAARLAVPAGIEGDVLVGPLGTAGEISGVLMLSASRDQTFTARHIELSRALMDPLSVALANDHQIRELARLREAAEAEKRSLLTRLGRRRMGDEIIGEASGLRMVMDRVQLVATSDVPVLIFGETGTGKELVARAIHNRSPRCDGPIIRVNCGAIPSELIDSELFGHERGAFTGAVEARKGWFERADGGTLFLDEIGELPPAVQVRLLRIVQDGWLERVGGEKQIHVDVRVVAATHRNLEQMVAEGRFREDLWYRISVFPIVLPPLRERIEDIPEMTRHFAERAAVRFGLPKVSPAPQDIDLLLAYPWPGNVRELATVIDRATILGDGKQLEVAKALGVSSPLPVRPGAAPAAAAQTPSDSLTLDDVMRQHIEETLARTKGRVEGPFGAAARLQINPHTLRARMRKLGIDWQRFRQSPGTR